MNSLQSIAEALSRIADSLDGIAAHLADDHAALPTVTTEEDPISEIELAEEEAPAEEKHRKKMISSCLRWTDDDNAILLKARLRGLTFETIRESIFPERTVKSLRLQFSKISKEHQLGTLFK